ncbi:MAG TPA: O-antigen ligase family protein [Burkholderiales bacterium]
MIYPARALEALVDRRGSTALDALLVAALAGYVVLFLAVRGGTNACLLALFLLALLSWIWQPATIGAAWRLPGSWMMVAALSSVFMAAIIAKLLRGGIDYIDLDGPSRFWVAALVMLLLTAKRVQFVRIFATALPFATLAALVAVFLHTDTNNRWNGRFATSFVDPNTLGSYAVILTFLTLLTVASAGDNSPWRRTLPWLGAAAGLLLAMFAASRGAWLAIPPLAALWLYFRARHGIPRLAWQGLVVLGIVILIVVAVPEVALRGVVGGQDVRDWVDGSNPVTPAGHRLSIWKLGLQLFAASPLVGYGWSNVASQLARPEFATAAPAEILYILAEGGPHNDLLTLALSHGVFGIAAYAALLFLPMAFFWRRLRTATGDARLACELGVCYTAGVMVCGLTNEMLSLKYLCSFYGLTVAGLAAQVLGADPATSKPA